MGKLEWWIVFFVAAAILEKSGAQQSYDPGMTKGYVCDSSNTTAPCQTYVYFVVMKQGMTVETVGALFQGNADEIANISGISSPTAALDVNQPLLVPLTCTCDFNRSEANVSYRIQQGDTFFDVANNTYNNLAYWQQIEEANPGLDARNLLIGQLIVVPVRCACPTLAQKQKGISFLLSYSVQRGDTFSTISAFFNVAIADLLAENELQSKTSKIYYSSTLLVPLTALPVLDFVPSVLPPPAPPALPLAPLPANKKSSSKTGLIAGLVVAFVIVTVFAVALIILLLRWRQPFAKQPGQEYAGDFKTLPSRCTTASDGKTCSAGDVLSAMSDLVGADRPLLFTYQELKEATNNFSALNKIQGSVYHGILNGTTVAIKQMEDNTTQELKIMFQVHHSSLVKLLGVCNDESSEHIYLVYEYVENGSLSDCLRHHLQPGQERQDAVFLRWNARLQIALDVATGLEYLHEYVSPGYLHKDIKSSNILLDGKLHAKIANFGMARSGVFEAVTRHISGTYGYMAPEYLQNGLVSTKIDVYAFGVVVLELLSGQEAVVRMDNESLEGQDIYLAETIGPVLDADNPVQSLRDWMDRALRGEYSLDGALSVANLARRCVYEDPDKRPGMKDVAFSLSRIVVTSLEWESSRANAVSNVQVTEV